MATPITLTQQPIRVTGAEFQPLFLSMDISQFDQLDIELGIIGFEGTAGVTVKLYTGMQNQTDDGWVLLHDYTSLSTVGYVSANISAGLLRYLRWRVTAVSGTAATFFIRGMGRSFV